MVSPRKKVKNGVWVIALFVGIIVYALLADWWKEHAILGWIILVSILGIVGYVLYRYASLRGWLSRQIKDSVGTLVFEKVASDREPLPNDMRNGIFERAQSKCENEQCTSPPAVKPVIHHIDGNNSNNTMKNLIALCPNCHQQAHKGIPTQSQLINWVNTDNQRLQARRAKPTGHCIRCNNSIAFEPKAPYCSDCYGTWAKNRNPNHEEKYCHRCGTPNKSASKNRPLCISCFKESKR